MTKKIGTPSNLIPLNTRTKEERIAIGRKGGLRTGKRKSEGARWRHIRERIRKEGFKDDDIKWLIERIENRDSMSSDILIFLEKIKNNPELDVAQRLSLSNIMVSVGKFIHGEKSKVEVSSVNLNIDVTREEIEEHIKKILRRNE